MLFNSKILCFLILCLSFNSCLKEEVVVLKKKQFERMEQTGIEFRNDLPYTEEFNTYTYRNFYNGGGVALGDINNDGLLDIYFSGNIEDNKLYLNKGDWKFEDITAEAGVACSDVWSTGVNFVDINADGWLDIYVCKAGKPGGNKRHNELFINQKNNTFSEASAAYGLDVTGLSIHSAFFDYDKDGDLDCYLLNNSLRSLGGFDFKKGLRDIPDKEGNKFFKNENGKFVDATSEVGMYSSNIGYGLGITLADFNQDSWADVFISNDFFERDYLYLNNKDGTFSEVAAESFDALSMGSMGADACDINNDLLPDLFVTEMLPSTLDRKKSKAVYEGWNKYSLALKAGYHHQFSRNSLQRNIGNDQFVEIGRLAGVAATEWSWASLIMDLDNDGKRDLFISNGVYKDLLDKDYLNYYADNTIIRAKIAKREKVLTALIDSMTSTPVPNFVFKNKGNFQFEWAKEDWGLADSTFSNGSAYGDLDNDGDLDLVVNNVNMPAYVYQNNLDTGSQRSIQFELKGSGKNVKALGAKIVIKYGKEQSMYEQYTSKGFQSSIDTKIHFGVGKANVIDSVLVYWPSGKFSVLNNLATNKTYLLEEVKAKNSIAQKIEPESISPQKAMINFEHKDVKLNLFSRQRMLVEMDGFDGPAMATADLNSDGIDDVFIGGGKNQSSALFLSQGTENYVRFTTDFKSKANAEVVDAQFFDSDLDGDLDLYVAHGGSSFSKFSPQLNDVLYINDGEAHFKEAKNALAFKQLLHTGAVAIEDLNNDKLPDIVVAEKVKNNQFGLPGSIFILLNKGANQYELLNAPALEEIGLISAIELLDINKDGWLDIVAAGKWMSLTMILSNEGSFQSFKQISVVENSAGMWNEIYKIDLDEDGDLDLLLGNEGENNFYKEDMRMYVNDFDKNGSREQIICENIEGKYYPIHDIDEMFSQMPLLKKKFSSYSTFSKVSIAEIFDSKNVESALMLELKELRSGALINNAGKFDFVPFPIEAQYSSTYAIEVVKSAQGNVIYLGGNNFRVKPQFGRQDASQGWKLNYSVNQGKINFNASEPLFIKGQIRCIKHVDPYLLFGINNDSVKIYETTYN